MVRDFHASRGKFVLQPVQCEMWRLPDPLHDESPMRLQNRLTVAAHLARRHRTRGAVALPPLHDGRHCNIEPGRHSVATLAGFYRLYGSFTKIIRKRSDHPMLASDPASILNHNPPLDGIPPDSINR
jgi:hypothetical protein